MARDKSHRPVAEKGKVTNLIKGDKAGAKNGQVAKSGQVPVNVRHVTLQTPIVMGRSVSVHHKTKLHHVKMKPLESIDAAASTDGSN